MTYILAILPKSPPSRAYTPRVYPPPLPVRSRPPAQGDWLHERRWDGFRFQIIKEGSDVPALL